MHELVERLGREVTEAVSGLTADETQVRPAVGKWSVQQIVEHLVLSYGTTCAVFETRLAKGTPTKGSPTLGQRVGQVAITRLGLFPKGRAAPAAVMPRDEPVRRLSGEELGGEVGKALGRMDGLLSRAEQMFGARRGVSHLILGPMSVQQWRRFHLVHGEHHIKQIAAARGLRG